MSMLENEECRAKSTGSQLSDYVAVVPIKKRRFPVVRPPSPPPLPLKIDQEQNGGSESVDPHISKVGVDVAASSSGSLEKSEKPLLVADKQKPLMERSNFKQEKETCNKIESVPVGNDVNLTWQTELKASGNQDKVDTSALRLSLSDGKRNVQSTSSVTDSDRDGSHLFANRSNWDLNTTMDAWEGSTVDTASLSLDSAYGKIRPNFDFHVKPLIGSAAMVGADKSRSLNFEDCQVKFNAEYPKRPFKTYEKTPKQFLPMHLLGSNLSQVPQISLASIDPKTNLARVLLPRGNSNVGISEPVKPEPFVELSKHTLAEVSSREFTSLSLNSKAVKLELSENCGSEVAGSSNCDTPNLVDGAVIKAGLGFEGRHLTVSTSKDAPSRSDVQISKGIEGCIEEKEAFETSEALKSKSNTSVDHHRVGDVDRELSEKQLPSQDIQKTASDTVSLSGRHVCEQSDVSNCEITKRIQDNNVGIVGNNKERSMEELPSSCGDEDCITGGKSDILAGMDEDLCNSEVNHSLGVVAKKEHFDREDHVHEDGEVWERPLVKGPITSATKMFGSDVAEPGKLGSPNHQYAASPLKEGEGNEMQLAVETDFKHVSVCTETNPNEKIQYSVTADSQLQESPVVELAIGDLHDNNPMIASQREVGSSASKSTLQDQGFGDMHGECGNNFADMVLVPGVESNAEETDMILSDDDRDECLTSSKREACLDGEVVGNSGIEGNRSRIINLSQASNLSSPGKTRSPSARDLPLQAGRRRLSDVAFEEDKLHLQGRDEVCDDDYHRFSRQRNRDMFYRNSRSSYACDRGRIPNNMCGDWESDQDFGSEIYNGPGGYRNNQYRKYRPYYRDYHDGPDDGHLGAGRGGRKFLNEEGTNFRTRRWSRGGRAGPSGMNGGPRNVSPNRCISENDSDIVEVRHRDKYMGDFGDDNNSMHPRNQPPYEEADGYIRGERNNMASFNSKCPRNIHSKSSISLRGRSPGQWSSPRRSPEGFVESTRRRSPGMYRRERVRSPERGGCFRGGAMIRRRNSPPYNSQLPLDDPREMDSGRDHGFGRPNMPHRTFNSRVSFRGRRYDMVNSRERTPRGGHYFRAPMRNGRFHDLTGERSSDERRQMGEKREPFRHYRPFHRVDEKKFLYNGEQSSSRSYGGIFPEDDLGGAGYHEGSNSRERQLERHNKNGGAEDAAHETTRAEEQEENFRHDGDEEVVDEMLQHAKRKRF